MLNPDFTQLELNTGHAPQSPAEWQAALERETGQPAADFLWRTMEQIDVRPLYTAADGEAALDSFRTVPFGKDLALGAGLQCRFERAGHILGAAWVTLDGDGRTVLFSGDIGRLALSPNQPHV